MSRGEKDGGDSNRRAPETLGQRLLEADEQTLAIEAERRRLAEVAEGLIAEERRLAQELTHAEELARERQARLESQHQGLAEAEVEIVEVQQELPVLERRVGAMTRRGHELEQRLRALQQRIATARGASSATRAELRLALDRVQRIDHRLRLDERKH